MTASSAAGFCHCSSFCRTKSCPVHYFRKTENVFHGVFLAPLFLHCGCPAVHGQCSTMHSMQRACPDGRYTDPRSILPQTAPLSPGQDIPLCPGFHTRLAPHQVHCPADTQHHEQPSKHCLLLLQPVEQPPVGGHTPRLNTAPVPSPPPTVAYTQVTKHILALGALVLMLLPGRERVLLNPTLAQISPMLNPEPDFTHHKTCQPSLPTQLCPRNREDVMLPPA